MDSGLRSCGALICLLFSVTAVIFAITVGSNLFVHEGESNTPAYLAVSGLAGFVGVSLGVIAVLLLRRKPEQPSAPADGFAWWFATIVIILVIGITGAIWLLLRLTGIWYAIT